MNRRTLFKSLLAIPFLPGICEKIYGKSNDIIVKVVPYDGPLEFKSNKWTDLGGEIINFGYDKIIFVDYETCQITDITAFIIGR